MPTRGMLLRVFGKNGLPAAYVRANGGDDAPVEQDDSVKSVSNEMTFASDLTARDEVEGAIATIAAKVGRRLRRKGLRGRTISLRVRYDDRSVRSVQRQLAAPSDDEFAYTPLLYRMMDELWRPGMPVRLIGVGMTGFEEGDGVQESLFDVAEAAPNEDDVRPSIPDEGKRRGLIEATDLVKDRFGESAVRFGRELRGEENTTGSAKEPGRLPKRGAATKEDPWETRAAEQRRSSTTRRAPATPPRLWRTSPASEGFAGGHPGADVDRAREGFSEQLLELGCIVEAVEPGTTR